MELLTAILRTDVPGVVLSGAAGVGKTRLAAELVGRAARLGRRTAWTLGTHSMRAIALGAFDHLVPATADAIPAVARALCPPGAGRLVLGVDDAHLLDDRSAELVEHLAATGSAFVVATVRRDEQHPDQVGALWTRHGLRRVELQALSHREVAELLVAALGGPVDAATSARIASASGGNPLFVRELVLAGRDRGALRQRDGTWCWSGDLTGGPRLAELVARRLDALVPAELDALQVLALAEPVGTAIMAAVTGPDAVGSLVRHGLAVVATEGRREFARTAHPLYAEAARNRLGPLRRREIHRALTDALAATGARGGDDVVRLSLWQLEAGVAGDPGRFLAAARRALATSDDALAARLASAAAQCGGGVTATVLHADALHRQGRHREAAELAGGPPADPELIAEWGLVAASIRFRGFGDVDEAERILRHSEGLCGEAARHGLLAERAAVALARGRIAEAGALAESVLAGTDDEPVRVRASTTATSAWAIAGRAASAAGAAAEALRAADRLSREQPALTAELLAAQVRAALVAGDLDGAERLAHAHDLRGRWAVLIAEVLLNRGHAGAAMEHLRTAAEAPAEIAVWAAALMGKAAALAGDGRASASATARAEELMRPSAKLFRGPVVLASAWTAAVEGRPGTARRLARAAAALAADAGQRSYELVALHDALRMGDTGAAGPLARCAASVEGDFAAAAGRHALAVLDGGGAALMDAARTFDRLGFGLHAAELAAVAAEAFQREGRRASRRAALAAAEHWADRCGSPTGPTLRRDASGLTEREREIAALAGEGLSNKEIAKRLGRSERTVGNHLSTVYAKLGVTGRSALPPRSGGRVGAAP
jgi:DNA-binding CsgD family transcriptional regulator